MYRYKRAVHIWIRSKLQAREFAFLNLILILTDSKKKPLYTGREKNNLFMVNARSKAGRPILLHWKHSIMNSEFPAEKKNLVYRDLSYSLVESGNGEAHYHKGRKKTDVFLVIYKWKKAELCEDVFISQNSVTFWVNLCWTHEKLLSFCCIVLQECF